ncbi:MAG: hypothetical protein ACOC0Q_08125 [Wenzhouxiangella sp.]
MSRKEIRRRVYARMGYMTSEHQAQQTLDQVNEFINAGALKVYGRCPWVRTLRETRLPPPDGLGIDQRFLTYPANTGPGNIQAIAVWDAEALCYRPLRRGRITIAMDDEPLVDEGEPASEPGRDRPRVYELKDQIEVWPRPDTEYEVKIDHTVHPQFVDDLDVSIVDAEAIILYVIADLYEQQGDDVLARSYRSNDDPRLPPGKFELRLNELAVAQHPLPTVQRGRWDRQQLMAPEWRGEGYVPTSGQWPSVAGD